MTLLDRRNEAVDTVRKIAQYKGLMRAADYFQALERMSDPQLLNHREKLSDTEQGLLERSLCDQIMAFREAVSRGEK